jgi:hypothetical protein
VKDLKVPVDSLKSAGAQKQNFSEGSLKEEQNSNLKSVMQYNVHP